MNPSPSLVKKGHYPYLKLNETPLQVRNSAFLNKVTRGRPIFEREVKYPKKGLFKNAPDLTKYKCLDYSLESRSITFCKPKPFKLLASISRLDLFEIPGEIGP